MKWITLKEIPPDGFAPWTVETEQRDGYVESITFLDDDGKPLARIKEVFGSLRVLVPAPPTEAPE